MGGPGRNLRVLGTHESSKRSGPGEGMRVMTAPRNRWHGMGWEERGADEEQSIN